MSETATTPAAGAAPAEPSTPAGAPAAAPAAPAKAPEPEERVGRKQTGNAFLDKGRGFASKLDGKLEASEKKAAGEAGKPAEPVKEGEKAPAGEPAKVEAGKEPPKEPAKAADAPKEGEKAPEKPGEKVPGAVTALQLVAKDGKTVELAWPEGAVLKVKGSGKMHTIEKPQQMMDLVQKGLDYDRLGSKLGERATVAEEKLKASQVASQKVLLAVLFGDDQSTAEEIREQLSPEMRKFLDPGYREGIEAKAKLKEREAADAEGQDADAQALSERVMNDAEQHCTEHLKQYEFLEPGDIPTIQMALHGEYERRFNARAAELLPNLRSGEMSPEEIQQDCEQVARAVLTTGALDVLMQKLNAEYARRLKLKGGQSSAAPSTPAGPPANGDANGRGADIEAHNATTDAKLEQADRSRTLRGAGTPPGTAPGKPSTDGMSFAERRKANSARLRSLGT